MTDCPQCGMALDPDGTCPNRCAQTTDAGPGGTDSKQRESQAAKLKRIAQQTGLLLCTSTREEPFAIMPGECIARPLRGGKGSVRHELARLFAMQYGKAPSAGVLAEMILTIEAWCYAGPVHELHLRTARDSRAAWLDLGGDRDELVKITPGEWGVVPSDGDGPLFRRTRLTGELPEPQRGACLGAFRDLLRLADDDPMWPLIAAWEICVLLLPAAPVPVLALTGEQGTAKSWQCRLLVSLADPSSVPLRAAPRDRDDWAVAAAASRVVALDNVSHIEPWLSDSLCRACTGDGLVRRALYTDYDVSVLSFRRAVLLNGITITGLRGDLADRLIRWELGPLPDGARRDEDALAAEWEKAHPAALGGLLDLAAGVFAALPGIEVDRLPRMADYARILAAVDQVLGTEGLEFYLGQREQLAAETVADDPVAKEVAAMAARLAKHHLDPWEGTAAALLELLRPEGAGDEWPKNGRGMTARLTRAAPMLRQTGTDVIMLDPPTDGHRQSRIWRVEQVGGERPERTQRPRGDESAGQGAGDGGDVAGTSGQRPGNVPGVSAGRDVGDIGDVDPLPLDDEEIS